MTPADPVQVYPKGGRVYLDLHTGGPGVFLTVRQARRLAHRIEQEAQVAHQASCVPCQTVRAAEDAGAGS